MLVNLSMIIVEGPDATGKTTLARSISEAYGMPYYHFAKDSTYLDYLKPLCNLELLNAVVDRWIFSEYPYSLCMGRRFAFSLKEWHNIVLLTLAHDPVVVLCTHEPQECDYPAGQYLPYSKWTNCLRLYQLFFESNHIEYNEYDYSKGMSIEALRSASIARTGQLGWWMPMWRAGYGYTGSATPDYLLIAERIGPNNVNNLPFETGPTGKMLSDMLELSDTPLGKFAVTNMVKSFRRDARPPNDEDIKLLKLELEHLKPKVAVFMGSISQNFGSKVAKDMGIKVAKMTHFGYYSHKGIQDITPLINQWRNIIGTKEVVIGKEGARPAVSFVTTEF